MPKGSYTAVNTSRFTLYVQVLLESGVSSEIRDVNGSTPLSVAACAGAEGMNCLCDSIRGSTELNADTLKVLLQCGADIDATDDIDIDTDT